jgi:hypothetical protein
MSKPAGPKQIPTWVKALGWLAFSLLALATLLVATRWLVMNSGHQTAQRIVDSRKKEQPVRLPAAPPTAGPAAAKTPGIPLSAIPHFGAVLSGDEDSWNEFSTRLIQYRRVTPERVDGVMSFRKVLEYRGSEVPDTMTEGEAAKEFLKRADDFSTLLDQWREAVAEGPWEKGSDFVSNPDTWRLNALAFCLSQLLEVTGAGAWADLQTMKNSNARLAEFYPVGSGYDGTINFWMLFGIARSGIASGAWTDGQMAEISSMVAEKNALADARQREEMTKQYITDYYTNFDNHREQFSARFLETPSKFDQMLNQVKLKLITQQQIRDNMEVQLAEVDHMFDRFDPHTGFYLPSAEEEAKTPPAKEGQPGMLGSFYFMIRDLQGPYGDEAVTAERVIWAQCQYDQFRLAAALESYKRKTGNYPDHLAAIDGQFDGAVPQDIATGQPYHYQKDPEGYTLWSAGIDGKSDGGYLKTDVTWKHRPVKPN